MLAWPTLTIFWATLGMLLPSKCGQRPNRQPCRPSRLMTCYPRHTSRWLSSGKVTIGIGRVPKPNSKRAIQLNANSATAHHWYGDFLARLGRSEEARTELKKAQELDPLSLLINTSVGRQLYFARQYETAIQQLKKTLDMDPNFVPAQHAIEAAYAQSGMYREAVAERQ